MSFIEFLFNNSKLLPKDIINKAQSTGWNRDAMFVKLKELGEYLGEEDGQYIVTKVRGKLVVCEKFDSWLEKRIDDMVKAI
jgi:hypothetical protein